MGQMSVWALEEVDVSAPAFHPPRSTTAVCSLMMPPVPDMNAMSQSFTCRAAAVPRICRTASITWQKPPAANAWRSQVARRRCWWGCLPPRQVVFPDEGHSLAFFAESGVLDGQQNSDGVAVEKLDNVYVVSRDPGHGECPVGSWPDRRADQVRGECR
jgi:hypothetical protein